SEHHLVIPSIRHSVVLRVEGPDRLRNTTVPRISDGVEPARKCRLAFPIGLLGSAISCTDIERVDGRNRHQLPPRFAVPWGTRDGSEIALISLDFSGEIAGIAGALHRVLSCGPSSHHSRLHRMD